MLQAGHRLLCASKRFISFVAYAGAAYEVRITPRTGGLGFGQATDEDLDDLAVMLPRVVGALRRARGNPPYNLVVASGPCAAAGCHLRLIPRIGRPGGFEMATGIGVSTVTAEDAAAHLRSHLAS
jgi:UDPglucose--hexose-1-phosphate uridylyltransferase